MKKILSFLLILSLSFCLFACGKTANEQEIPEKETVKIGLLAGPTGMGAAKLVSDSAKGETELNYVFEVFGAPTDVTGLIVNGELDIAMVPTNLACTLYNKTKGNVQILAVNTLGVLYVCERGNTVNSLEDLNGKKIVLAGKSATPEYVLEFICENLNIKCETEFVSTHAEAVASALAGNADIVLLPEPNVTTLLAKSQEFRVAIDLNKEYEQATENSSIFAMGCVVAKKDKLSNETLNKFLKEYSSSVEFVNGNIEEASVLIAEQGIVPSKEIAQKAIPNSNLVCITGEKMKTETEPFVKMLNGFDANVLGGGVPNEDFWFMG